MALFRRILGMMDVADVGNILQRTHAMIKLTPGGVVRTANKRFLTTLGYSLAEIKGESCQKLYAPSFVAGPAYGALWEKLGRGEADAGLHPYRNKDGKEVWLHTWYVPMGSVAGSWPSRHREPRCRWNWNRREKN